jgi:PAS domain S-box-containing protein
MVRRTQVLSLANRLAPQLFAAQYAHDLYVRVFLALHDLGIVGSIALLQPDGALVHQPSPHAASFELPALPHLFEQTQALLIEQVRVVCGPTLLDQITTEYAPHQIPLLIEPIALPYRMVRSSQEAQHKRLDWSLPLMLASLGRENRNERMLVLCVPGLSRADETWVMMLANYLIAALQQIELRNQMEDQIGRLELIIRHVPDTLLVVRPDMTMSLLNEQPLRTAGYQRHHIDGRLITDIVPPQHHHQLFRTWEAARHGETQRFELEVLRHDGTPMICAVTAGRIPGSDEVLAIVTDMTVRQRLYQAEKMAALGRLVAGVAHELNNPLAVILGLVQLNLMDSLPHQLRDDLHNVEQATLRASRIVQQLTTFVQPHGTRPLPINLVEVMHDVAEKSRSQATNLGVQIETDVDLGMPKIEGNVFQIQQVLMNVVSNALHAVARQPEGHVRLIRLRGWGEGQRVRMLVSDTGEGIAHELLLRIFEPFYTTRAVGQGVGLGLAIAFAIIQQHSGQIWAENDLSNGTVFHISLPARSGVEHDHE